MWIETYTEVVRFHVHEQIDPTKIARIEPLLVGCEIFMIDGQSYKTVDSKARILHRIELIKGRE